MIRTFVAAELPDRIKDCLDGYASGLRGLKLDASFPSSEAMHLTLKFLGEIEESLLPELTAQLKRLSALHRPFEVEVSGMGVFPNLGNPRVVWAGIAPCRPLSELQSGVEAVLSPLGFTAERRPFQPHLTLARIRSRRNIAHLIGHVESRSRALQAGRFEVNAIHLFQSLLTPEGARYRKLDSFPLQLA